MKIPKITKAKFLKNNMIVYFDNNVVKELSLKPYLKQTRFRFLAENPKMLKRFSIDGGYAISWDDFADISENEIWKKGKKVKP